MKINLNGNWKLKNVTDNNFECQAQIPSTNFNDLMKAGLIPDPFYKTNEKDTLWIGDKDWSYSRSFIVEESVLSNERVDLVADCLDAVSEIYINGKLVKKTFNAHVGYRFSVKEFLMVGTNQIEIIFRSPNEFCLSESKRIGKNFMVTGIDKRVFLRKNQSHFGWDWGPEVVYSGITKDIYIDYGSALKISNVSIKQNHENSCVNLDVSFDVDEYKPTEMLNYYTLSIVDPNGVEVQKSGIINAQNQRTICIENPIFWWTHELNPVDKQALYTVKIELGKDGEYDSKEIKIGIRTIELNREKDEYGSDFKFILNGVPIFAKGANWIPADSFADRINKDTFEYYVDSAIEANMNMIRIWGGGFYEDDEFYNLCDEKGILLWQDFGFACRPYPFFDESFKKQVEDEVAYNVKRLRNHACLCLWCGNNELEQMFNTWFWQSAFVKANRKFFWEELEPLLRKYDTQTPYIPTTPVGVDFNKAVSSDNHGDNHLWVVWHGLQDVKYYRKRLTRFCSEFGFESLPDLKTIEKFAEKEDYSINSKVFLAHQKCMLGNQKMEYYITSRFRIPKKFEDYVYLSQACQMECIKDATEFWRRNRHRCNGSLYWQLNDCWPVCSWSSMDYYGNYKALQYHAKHFFAPLATSIENDGKNVRVFILNDTLESKSVELKLKIVDFDKGLLSEKVFAFNVDKLSNIVAYDVKLKDVKKEYDLSNVAFVCDLLANGEVINTKTLLFKYEKYLNLQKANVSVKTEVADGVITYRLNTDKFARLVRLHDKVSTLPFSDNWFDLIPGEEKVVSMPYYEGFAESNLECFSSTDVEPKGSRLYDLMVKGKFILNPVNLAIYLGQPQTNFDYKDRNE